ncbi:MAG: hypothetical protein C0404_04280 [Verrucomicrobia bacterium]|nr:hypothetical protein [Verrucomicrobiota bacterium]
MTIRIEHAGRLHIDTLDLCSARWMRNLAQDLCRMFDETPEDMVKLTSLSGKALFYRDPLHPERKSL